MSPLLKMMRVAFLPMLTQTLLLLRRVALNALNPRTIFFAAVLAKRSNRAAMDNDYILKVLCQTTHREI